MTWAIRERRAFERLLAGGRRFRSETLWCKYLDDPDAVPPRVAYSIGRSVGSAVSRNRLRRRLRAIVAQGAGRPPLERGWLIVGATPAAAERSFVELQTELGSMLASVGSVR